VWNISERRWDVTIIITTRFEGLRVVLMQIHVLWDAPFTVTPPRHVEAQDWRGNM
jgi:hypothetical protein